MRYDLGLGVIDVDLSHSSLFDRFHFQVGKFIGRGLQVAILLESGVIGVTAVTALRLKDFSQNLLSRYEFWGKRVLEGAEDLSNLSVAERDFYAKAKLLGSYDYLQPGQLPNDISVTFIGSRYKSYKLLDDVVLERAGTRLKPFGQSFSFDRSVSELQTRIDKAILPKWPNGGASSIDTGFSIRIPKDSIVHVGDIVNQGKIFMGDTRQVVVQAPWSIPGVEIVDTYPLQEEALWNEIANQFKK